MDGESMLHLDSLHRRYINVHLVLIMAQHFLLQVQNRYNPQPNQNYLLPRSDSSLHNPGLNLEM